MSTFTNSYKAPAASFPENVHLDTAEADYDYNFMFEPKTLQSDRVVLRPFLPSRDAQHLLSGIQANPELVEYVGCGVWQTLNEVCVWAEQARRHPGELRYSVYSAPLDRLDAPVEDYVFAGTMSMIESSYDNMMSEIGWIFILTPFQRTHVLSNACGLLMHRILDSVEQGGLGLRRCQWKANSLNKKSGAAAERLGFVHEGIIKAWIVVPEGKPSAHVGRPGRLEKCGQRDTWMAGITWYDWEDKTRAHVDQLMARRK